MVLELRMHILGWHDLLHSDQKVAADHAPFSIWIYYDPLYRESLMRKQLLGRQRQFVFAKVARFRLPELGLLAANILAHIVAELPALPTGF